MVFPVPPSGLVDVGDVVVIVFPVPPSGLVDVGDEVDVEFVLDVVVGDVNSELNVKLVVFSTPNVESVVLKLLSETTPREVVSVVLVNVPTSLVAVVVLASPIEGIIVGF